MSAWPEGILPTAGLFQQRQDVSCMTVQCQSVAAHPQGLYLEDMCMWFAVWRNVHWFNQPTNIIAEHHALDGKTPWSQCRSRSFHVKMGVKSVRSAATSDCIAARMLNTWVQNSFMMIMFNHCLVFHSPQVDSALLAKARHFAVWMLLAELIEEHPDAPRG